MTGGAPATQAYADEIGADGYAPGAAAAVESTRSLV
jgi:5-methyltetrahydrofolate--homocysteine methyltransferase